ncbi:type IV secretion protein Rhs [Frateuria sp. Soil773]|uniref:type VI secretion system Vgr family protein n=1 Tax=Frateuria sp. Soil773 TaxID=1736407 RepID=UPI0006F6917C|nr:type VI secretion system tip protein TssI/VgrG [Frateuria sp. Soil773]KRE88299.1 type IV secretion protein Rhs [Frateuria sp. Soil773]
MAHAITLSSNLGDALLFARMVATERLGRLFSYELELLSENAQVDLRKLLGTPMTVRLKTEDGYERHFNGIVCEAAQTGFETIQDVRYAAYRVRLVPKPWLLSRKVDCRIYAEMSVPEIVRTVLGEIGYADLKLSLSGNYPKREYCVQYREDYLNFISRLMEQEGIYYFFTHTASTHTMVLADALGAHAAARGFEKIPYCPPTERGKRNAASIAGWSAARTVHPVKYQLTDYDPLNPKTSLLATESVDNGADYHGISGLDVFDYPGRHALADDGRRYAQVRMEAANVPHQQFAADTDACGMAAGALFTLQDFPLSEANREYLVTGTRIELEEVGYVSGGSGGEPFACRFEAIRSSQPFRSPHEAAAPRIVGLQTAIVTGSDTDEDIAVDKYGRVQVTFHWNKPDKAKARSSCPVRVASPWAGKNWGAVSIPRVGQEVVVSFLEGDPDRPLIIGSVYNADNLPPYSLPDNKTQSGIKSRSLNGAAADANELRFEDKKGSEELFLHAQKDMREEVENDHFVQIDHDETVTVKNDQSVKVEHDQKLDVTHDRTHTVGNEDKLDVTANGTTSIGQKFKLSAGTEIELVTGASSIVMKSSGEIQIKGVNITIAGNATVKMEGQAEVGIKAGATMDIGAGASLKVHSDAMLEVAGSAMTTVKGAMLTLKGDAMAQVSGGMIMIG